MRIPADVLRIGHHNEAALPPLKFGFSAPLRAPFITRYSAFLPGTVNRVKTLVSHRKQTTEHPSTRNVPAHTSRTFFRSFSDGLA